ncbi:MAG: PAS and ANTAR domain-containing protein [Mycolicibacterium neoaurum]|uniref:PAS and ANTAR domain-containing protein n=2 Tax=Mycolicibacterium neoaurum TaxID=1795 RepID=UPI002FF8E44A
MTDDVPDGQPTVERVLADGGPRRVGWYRFYFADERWEWSPEVERMHGYEAGTARPTTELVLAHKHPDDCGQVAATLDEVRRTATAFSTRHRIVDTRGDTHDVVVVGDRLFDESGCTVIGSHGFYIDLTPPRATGSREHQNKVSEAVAEISEARSGIEQAKGMLMLIYRIGEDAAFELLRWRSQETNTRLKSLAQQLVKDFLELDYHEQLPHRSVYDRLLLTAHLRADS